MNDNSMSTEGSFAFGHGSHTSFQLQREQFSMQALKRALSMVSPAINQHLEYGTGRSPSSRTMSQQPGGQFFRVASQATVGLQA